MTSNAAKMAQFFQVVLIKVSSLLQVSSSEVRETEWEANYRARQEPETGVGKKLQRNRKRPKERKAKARGIGALEREYFNFGGIRALCNARER